VSNEVAERAGWVDPPPRKGFFTDTSVCIGCKACEVACKEWNHVPEDGLAMLGSSYDNTGALGASTWRHVAFIEQPGRPAVDLGMPSLELPGGHDEAGARTDFRWLMSSDVCKHCTEAGCLDVCPTGSLFRTEFGTVVVQDDICNGCGYCVPACPYGVIDRRIGDKAVSIWLKADADIILRRVKRRPERPLLRTPDPAATIERLIAEREPIYKHADLTIASRDVPHDKIVDECVDALHAHLHRGATQ